MVYLSLNHVPGYLKINASITIKSLQSSEESALVHVCMCSVCIRKEWSRTVILIPQNKGDLFFLLNIHFVILMALAFCLFLFIFMHCLVNSETLVAIKEGNVDSRMGAWALKVGTSWSEPQICTYKLCNLDP